jgi:hypothetical protein
MTTPSDLRAKAVLADEQLRAATDEGARADYLTLARGYRELADKLEGEPTPKPPKHCCDE